MPLPTRVADVHILNLMYLQALQRAVQSDITRAGSMYGISLEDAEALRGLSLEAIHSLATSHNTCIAALRVSGPRLRDLAAEPTAVRMIFGALQDHPQQQAASWA